MRDRATNPDRGSGAPPRRARVGAVDIGTNTVLMLVAERGADGASSLVDDFAAITRLGRGVDRTGRLDDRAIRDTIDALRAFAGRARELGATRIGAVATSACRDAINGTELQHAASIAIGGSVEVISGEREARLAFAGSLGGLPGRTSNTAVVVDVGGGSTEVVIGDERALHWSHSYDFGSVRLTERHLRHDPPADEELAAVAGDIAAAMRAVPPPDGPYDEVVAIAGTATTYAAIDLELEGARYREEPPHGHRMTPHRVRELADTLSRLGGAARRAVIGLDPGRADVIVAGGVVLAEVAERLGAKSILISDRGVRWGLAEELLGAAELHPEDRTAHLKSP